MRLPRLPLGALVAVLCALPWVAGGEDAKPAPPSVLVPSPESGWPQWRGPRRDGLSTETGLLQSWPADGPPRLWTAAGLGRGYASPIVSSGRLFIAGAVGEETRVFALDLDGKPLWQAANGKAWKQSYPGARASCTLAGGRVYHLNANGRLVCLAAATGKEIWAVEVLQRFGGQVNTWGLSESVLVDRGRVFVTPGGREAFMAALDAATGATVWASAPLPEAVAEGVGYASPILVRFADPARQVLFTLSQRSVVAVDADSGQLLWHYPHPTRHNANCATPVHVGNGCIFHTNPVGSGGVLLRVLPGDPAWRVEKVWECALDNISGGAVLVAGTLFGSGHMNTGWVAVDATTGQQRFNSKALAQGALMYADNRLYCLSETGEVALVDPRRLTEFGIVSRFRFSPKKGQDFWAHPVVCDGRLCLRYHDDLFCYDVRTPQGAGNAAPAP